MDVILEAKESIEPELKAFTDSREIFLEASILDGSEN